jgi:hypothetical protein
MTRRIEAILEILAAVRAATGSSATPEAIREHRLATTRRIAVRRQCDERSVRDTHTDQLKPDIQGVGEFDALVQDWLTRGDGRLRTVLLRHGDGEDQQCIERFFASPPATHERDDADRPVGVELPGEVGFPGGFVEGATRPVFVNAYERNPDARATCIAHYHPVCRVCACDFRAVYGPVAEGFIHVHHLKPLSEIGEEYVVDPIKDLRPVCPNCHAVIHLGGECRTINEVRRLIGKPPLPEC